MATFSPLDVLNPMADTSKLTKIKDFLLKNWQVWVLLAGLAGLHISVQTDPNATSPSIIVVVPSGPLVSGSSPDMSPLAKEVDKINKALELVKKHKFKTFQEAYDSLK